MNFHSFVKPLVAVIFSSALFSTSAVVVAQQQEMTIEELERYIAEQKAALQQVKENRDITEQKAREVREALAEQEARRALVEQELDALCKEQEELKPGSFEACKAGGNS